MITLVDSSVWIDFFNGRPSPQALYFRNRLREQIFLTGDLMLAEVLQGFRDDREFEAARSAMLRFEIVELGGEQAAVRSARHYRLLRSKGVTVCSAIDCLVATYCITHNCALLHSDRDYSHYERYLGLRIARE